MPESYPAQPPGPPSGRHGWRPESSSAGHGQRPRSPPGPAPGPTRAVEAPSPPRPAPGRAPAGFHLQQVAKGVFALTRREPIGYANHSNNVFIVRDQDVVVVDTPFTLAETRSVVAALRSLTSKPVRYVINTHWHDDHTFGNQVYQDSFPGVEFIAQANTRESMVSTGVHNRRQQVEGGPDAVARFRRALDQGTNLQGEPLTEDERVAYVSSRSLIEQYLSEQPAFRLTLPSVTFQDRFTLDDGGRTVELRYLGRGNTEGDAVVWLPRDSVLITGDLVNSPFPSAFGSYPNAWVEVLQKLEALQPKKIIPGHGPVMHDDTAIRFEEYLLTSLLERTRAAVARGDSLEQVFESIRADGFSSYWTGGNKMLESLFDSWFVGPVVRSEFGVASGTRP